FLQPPLDGVCIQRLLIAFVRASGKEHAPKAAAVVSRHFEQRAPFVGVGKIIARALRMLAVEGERRGQHKEALRMRIALKAEPERLAYRGGPPARADQRSGTAQARRGLIEPKFRWRAQRRHPFSPCAGGFFFAGRVVATDERVEAVVEDARGALC